MAAAAGRQFYYGTTMLPDMTFEPDATLMPGVGQGYPIEAVLPHQAENGTWLSNELLGFLYFLASVGLWVLDLALTVFVNWLGGTMIQLELAGKETWWSKATLKVLCLVPRWTGNRTKIRALEESVYQNTMVSKDLNGTYKRYEDPATCITNENFRDKELAKSIQDLKDLEKTLAQINQVPSIVETPKRDFKPPITSTDRKVIMLSHYTIKSCLIQVV